MLSGGGYRGGARLACLLMQRCIEAKSVTKEDTRLLRHYGTKVVSEINSINRRNEHESIVGRDCYPDNETAIQLSHSPAWRYPTPRCGEGTVTKDIHENNYNLAVCTAVRTEEAHGGVKPPEHSVDTLNANNQTELERGVEQDNNHSTPIFELGMNVVTEVYMRSTPLSRSSNAHLTFAKNFDLHPRGGDFCYT